MKIRPIEAAELPLLEDFLYLAVFVPEGAEMPPRDVIFNPPVYVYIEDYGKKDDFCLVAEENGKIIGAAWSRILPQDGKRGYGNIDPHTPELAISVLPDYRGKGVGTALLTALFDTLAEHHYSRLSLSVQKENPAFRLYRRVGFEIVRDNGEDYIMVKKLADCEMDIDKLRHKIRTNGKLERVNQILAACDTVWLASVTPDGFPRVCAMEKVYASDCREVLLLTTKNANKVKHFRGNNKVGIGFADDNNSVSLIGHVTVDEIERHTSTIKATVDSERWFVKDGTGAYAFCVLRFVAERASGFIDGGEWEGTV
jgi:ribosomal protein S18 acetylase RimI-like enzyme/general stress protein 26